MTPQGHSSQVYVSTRELNVRVKEEKQLTFVYLDGFMAQLEVYKFKATVDDLLKLGARMLLIDLSNVTFIDSAGIGALCTADGECRRVGGHATYVLPLSSPTRQSINSASLYRKLDFHPDLADAAHSLASGYGIQLPSHITRSDASPAPAPAADRAAAPLDEILRRLDEIERRLGRLEAHRNSHPLNPPL